MVCHGLATFADALRAGSAEAKVLKFAVGDTAHIDALRAGSAEAKVATGWALFPPVVAMMHSVQAAPRQRLRMESKNRYKNDALRAGSAEAKR